MAKAAVDVDGSASSSASFGSRGGRFEGSGFRAVAQKSKVGPSLEETHLNHLRPLPKGIPTSLNLEACRTLRQRSWVVVSR